MHIKPGQSLWEVLALLFLRWAEIEEAQEIEEAPRKVKTSRCHWDSSQIWLTQPSEAAPWEFSRFYERSWFKQKAEIMKGSFDHRFCNLCKISVFLFCKAKHNAQQALQEKLII